jgi:acetyl esterase/lipase
MAASAKAKWAEEGTMASQESEALKTLYRGWATALAANPEMPLDELRLMFEHWGDVTAEPGGVDYIETNADGVPALWAVPKGCTEDRILLCTHGGGYVTASMYTHRKVYGHLAKAIGCRSLILHYRRAPEHPHPAI